MQLNTLRRWFYVVVTERDRQRKKERGKLANGKRKLKLVEIMVDTGQLPKTDSS